MAVRSSMLHVRVDDETKQKATVALNSMGLSVSDGVRLFLKRVVAEQALPLEMKVPNTETRAAMDEADEISQSRRTRSANADEMIARLEETDRK